MGRLANTLVKMGAFLCKISEAPLIRFLQVGVAVTAIFFSVVVKMKLHLIQIISFLLNLRQIYMRN